MSQIANLFGGGGSGLTPGTTPIVGGTNKRVLFDDNGVLGEDAGLTYDKSTGIFTTKSIVLSQAANQNGILATGYSLTGSSAQSLMDLSGTINTSGSPDVIAIRITDTARGANTKFLNIYGGAAGATSKFSISNSGNIVTAGGLTFGAGQNIASATANVGIGDNSFLVSTAGEYGFTNGAAFNNSVDTRLTRGGAAATVQLGAPNVNGSAVAQTLRVQSAVTGTDQNAANFTIQGSRQTGAGLTGQIIFQTSPQLASGATQGSYATALTLTAPAVNMQPSVVLGNQAIATTATDGFLYITTCAGAPTGVPTAFAGRAAIVFDTSSNQLWIYDAGWLQPKTAGAVSLVSWQ